METVSLQRPNASTPWGFRLRGGIDQSSPLCVQRVTPGSIVAAALSPGDVLVKITGVSTDRLTHADAQELIKECGNFLQLTLLKSKSQFETTLPEYCTLPRQNRSIHPSASSTSSDSGQLPTAVQPSTDSFHSFQHKPTMSYQAHLDKHDVSTTSQPEHSGIFRSTAKVDRFQQQNANPTLPSSRSITRIPLSRQANEYQPTGTPPGWAPVLSPMSPQSEVSQPLEDASNHTSGRPYSRQSSTSSHNSEYAPVRIGPTPFGQHSNISTDYSSTTSMPTRTQSTAFDNVNKGTDFDRKFSDVFDSLSTLSDACDQRINGFGSGHLPSYAGPSTPRWQPQPSYTQSRVYQPTRNHQHQDVQHQNTVAGMPQNEQQPNYSDEYWPKSSTSSFYTNKPKVSNTHLWQPPTSKAASSATPQEIKPSIPEAPPLPEPPEPGKWKENYFINDNLAGQVGEKLKDPYNISEHQSKSALPDPIAKRMIAGGDKKPFTYTPQAIDLVEISKERRRRLIAHQQRMAKRHAAKMQQNLENESDDGESGVDESPIVNRLFRSDPKKQSKSFKILQMLTDSEVSSAEEQDIVEKERQVVRKKKEQRRRRPTHDEDEMRFSGLNTSSQVPGRSFAILQQELQSSTSGGQQSPEKSKEQDDSDEAEDIDHMRYRGANIPSRAFRLLQTMTSNDSVKKPSLTTTSKQNLTVLQSKSNHKNRGVSANHSSSDGLSPTTHTAFEREDVAQEVIRKTPMKISAEQIEKKEEPSGNDLKEQSAESLSDTFATEDGKTDF